MPVIGVKHKIVYNNATTSKLLMDYSISVTEKAVIDVVAKNDDYKFTGFLPDYNDIKLEDSKYNYLYATSVDLAPSGKGIRITFGAIAASNPLQGDLALTNLDEYFLENNASTLQLSDDCKGCYLVGGVQYLSTMFERIIEIKANDAYFLIDERDPKMMDDFVYTCGDTKLMPTAVIVSDNSLKIVCPKINSQNLGKNFHFNTNLIMNHFVLSAKFYNIHLVSSLS